MVQTNAFTVQSTETRVQNSVSVSYKTDVCVLKVLTV